MFLPVLDNGWVVSTSAPQYHPTYAMNKAMTLLAEDLGFQFCALPVKYRGFGGPTEQWDYVAGIVRGHGGAGRGHRPHSALWLGGLADRASAITAVAPRRLIISPRVVSGSTWCPAGRRRNTCRWGSGPVTCTTSVATSMPRYVDILKRLWSQRVDYDGDFSSCTTALSAAPGTPATPGVCRAIGRGHAVYRAARRSRLRHGDLGGDAVFAANRKLQRYAAETGRDVSAYVLYTLVPGETEEEARAKSDHWTAHPDREALATMMGQAALDAAGGTAAALQGVAYIGITPIIGSYAQCAAVLDHIGTVPGTQGSC